MKLYFAGSFSGVSETQLKIFGVRNRLCAFGNQEKQAIEFGSKGLLLDSGAFSLFTRGKMVNIDELIKFIKKHKPENYIQLDVINDDEATWTNYKYMRSKNLLPLPVIHFKATKKHIDRCIDESNYICFGGLVPLSKNKKLLNNWLSYLFSFTKLRIKKIHCLGIMSKSILSKYPFYSADSSSALSLQRYPSSNVMERLKQKTKHYTELYESEIKKQLALEKYITDLWTKRGVVWDE